MAFCDESHYHYDYDASTQQWTLHHNPENTDQENSFIIAGVVTVIILFFTGFAAYGLVEASDKDGKTLDDDKKERSPPRPQAKEYCGNKDDKFRNCRQLCEAAKNTSNACACVPYCQCLPGALPEAAECMTKVNLGTTSRVSQDFWGSRAFFQDTDKCEVFLVSNNPNAQEWDGTEANVYFTMTKLENHDLQMNMIQLDDSISTSLGTIRTIPLHVKIYYGSKKMVINDKSNNGWKKEVEKGEELNLLAGKKHKVTIRLYDSSAELFLDDRAMTSFNFRLSFATINAFMIKTEYNCVVNRIQLKWPNQLGCFTV